MTSAPATQQRRPREKKTPWRVRIADRAASSLIIVGGMGTIVSVSLVFVLLVWVVAPLFRSASVGPPTRHPAPWSGREPLAIGTDEYRLLGWAIYPDGQLQIFRVDNGDELGRHDIADGRKITAVSAGIPDGDVALALGDGSVRLGRIGFKTRFLNRQSMPATLKDLREGAVGVLGQEVVQLTPERQFRAHSVVDEFLPPLKLGNSPIRIIDHVARLRGPLLAALSDDGKLRFGSLRRLHNLLTDKTTLKPQLREIPLPDHGKAAPWKLLLPERGESLYVVWRDGHLVRLDTRKPDKVRVAETVELLDRGATEIGAICFALGRETLVVGDNRGRLRAWFPVRHEAATTSDGFWLLPVHELPAQAAAVTALGISPRNRMIAAGYADGSTRAFYITTEQMVGQLPSGDGQPVLWASLSPKSPLAAAGAQGVDAEAPGGLLAGSKQTLSQSAFVPRYPEATAASLFRPLWYESYERPDHVWQTSAADATEMKLGLWPLVFGTLKGTLYAMLFSVPLALLAAIYTSEFLSRRLRSKIKPLVEMMASVPSVLLGFLAALVIAPLAEKFVPAVLAMLLTVPLALLSGAFLWQQIPRNVALRLTRFRLPLVGLVLAGGIAATFLVGPLLERWLFAGSLTLWLDGQRGSGTGGWLLVLLPISALLSAVGISRLVNPWLVRISAGWSRGRFALLNLVKFALAAGLTLLAAAGLGAALVGLGFDPRGSLFDTYVQRNALVVGFAMGFAVVPLIYTIAEDALSSVPGHLRSASLGAGATPWQTAVRIVVPTAASGLFSAVMIGLGRAVGETMIMLMALGNTPIREWNIFNGAQTLSAGVAAELSDAVKDSTHYRTLFLAALCLFLLTFVINTVAELVRLRFRRRAIQL